MRFYISARYGRREEAEALGNQLIAEGYEITSQWIWRNQPQDYEDATDDEVAEFAREDLEDVSLANALIALSEPSENIYGRGGRHVEYGYAVAQGFMELYVVGPRENIFHYMPDVIVTSTIDELIEYLRENR